MSANFVGNTLTQSEAIETYTPYDVTSSRPRKTTIPFLSYFFVKKNLLVGASLMLWTGQWASE